MKISIREEFNAPVEKVFAAVTDVEAAVHWMPNLVSMKLLTEGPYGVGTKWREARKLFGKEAVEIFEVTAFEPGRRIELYMDGRQGSTGRGEFRYRYDFDAQNGRTVMNLQGDITGMGCAGAAFGWLFKGMFRKAVRKDHEALRDYIEAQV